MDLLLLEERGRYLHPFDISFLPINLQINFLLSLKTLSFLQYEVCSILVFLILFDQILLPFCPRSDTDPVMEEGSYIGERRSGGRGHRRVKKQRETTEVH